jgi:predicted DNA-binding transcriptional regulator YafY
MQKAFCNLVLATRDHCEVRLLYKRLGDEEGERRHLRPLHLANLDHNWMLIAYDCGRKALRQFRIDRMSGVRIQDATFTPPAGFDARAYIRNCMGGFGGDATYDLEIRIAPVLVPYFNGNKWNDSQTVTSLPDGSAILRLRSNNYEASRRKILELGALAVVTAPADFRDRLAREIDAMSTLYKSKAKVPLASVPR